MSADFFHIPGYNPIERAFQAAEDDVHLDVNIAAPIIKTLNRIVQFILLIKSIAVESISSKQKHQLFIKEQPQEIYQQAWNKVVYTMRSAGQQRAHPLKDLSWQKATEALATQ